MWIGGKMIWEGLRKKTEEVPPAVSFRDLMIQGIATSIDALSVGFTISSYGTAQALTSSLIIAAVTFALCLGGLRLGRAFGTKLSSGASLLGGCILVAIGVKILLT
jgi:putative Mn2+ efflux pump MntP